ncbi:MAG: hypothetical protein ACP5FL_06295 [Thermoplasmatota archaeon]
MDTTTEGFILANKFRKAVFVEVATGEQSPRVIAKKHHLVPQMVDNAVGDLKEKDILVEKNGKLVLTEQGEKVYADMRSRDAL